MNDKKVLLNLVIIIIEILVLAPISLIIYQSFSNEFFTSSYIYIPMLLAYSYIPLFVASYVIRLRHIFVPKSNKKGPKHTLLDQIILKVTLGLSLIFVCITAWAIYSLANEGVPQFFPLDDPNATYTVETYYDKYMIHYHTDQQTEKNSYQTCQFIESKRVCTKEYTYDVMVMVGRSPVELQNLDQKHVQIDGKFVFANQQCIADKCVDMKMGALDIKSIKEIN